MTQVIQIAREVLKETVKSQLVTVITPIGGNAVEYLNCLFGIVGDSLINSLARTGVPVTKDGYPQHNVYQQVKCAKLLEVLIVYTVDDMQDLIHELAKVNDLEFDKQDVELMFSQLKRRTEGYKAPKSHTVKKKYRQFKKALKKSGMPWLTQATTQSTYYNTYNHSPVDFMTSYFYDYEGEEYEEIMYTIRQALGCCFPCHHNRHKFKGKRAKLVLI